MGVRRSYVWVLATYLVAVAVGVGAVAATVSGWVGATAVGLAFGLAAAVGVLAFRQLVSSLYSEQERHRQALFDAELSTLARQREAGQMREDLIASVSHEFRTPLTAIRGSAATLVQRYEQLDRDAQEDLLVGILEHSDRLNRLLEDMLVAASASSGEPGGIADVGAAVCQFSLGAPRPPVQVDVAPHLAACITPDSLARVITALAEHVRAAARRDRTVFLDGRRAGDEVLVTISYSAADPRQDVAALLDPFGGDQSAAGRPASLGLYVVRRLIEAHGGTVTIRNSGEDCTVRLTLRALGHRVSPERGPQEPERAPLESSVPWPARAEPPAARQQR
jgi:signal transduction histidine kinase